MTKTGASADAALAQRQAVARRVADGLRADPHVAAVLIFGSVASGCVDARSDVDVLVVCDPVVPSLAERREGLVPVGSGWTCMDGDDFLAGKVCDGLVMSIPVTLHYQTVAGISAVLQQVLSQGAITTEQWAFRPYTLPALLQRGWVVWDRAGQIARWRQQARVYPRALRTNILRHFAPLLREHLADLCATAERGLGPRGFLFFLNRAVDDLTSIVFALNEVYDPADRRMDTQVVPYLPSLPQDYVTTLTEVLEGPFDDHGMRHRARLFERLATEVLQRAESGA